jgi:menaquinone-dependent protoporphyrinogen oxidase
MTRILVAFASKHNSTAEIASYIGQVLRESVNFEVHVRSVDTIVSVASYDAVILGSAVYAGKWQTSAEDFVLSHRIDLAKRYVWLFSSGPLGKGDPKALTNGWEIPETLESAVIYIAPRDVAVFSGKLDPEDLGFVERFITKVVKNPSGDFRDWNMIRNWAKRIAETLYAEESQRQHV